ncbi:hypothetical protein AUQ44_01205 [Vibrio cidicii]|uniref:Uncharacterized protein n=1 Tax=Vibrio cidicii TaxID=1763883 RepID=A0A151JFR8_9VIBR|nr:hypothetical protein AUQ44_01205 [Vibrio cidicii]
MFNQGYLCKGENMERQAKTILLYLFVSVYGLTALGTLAMLFFGFGDVKEAERSTLVNTFLVETAVAIGALFYSVWGLNKKDRATEEMAKSNAINPLDSSFKDKIIPLENLKLPTIQLHENKHFKGCKFVGPSSLVILGGTIHHNGFSECGDFIALPDNVYMTGMLVFKNCTIEDCEFLRITIFSDKGTAKGLATIEGSSVKGI